MKTIRFGIIGLGLMGREIASNIARWCHLLQEGPMPQLTGICDVEPACHPWFLQHFPDMKIVTTDYRELINSAEIDAVYCAVPHNLHEKFYIDIIRANKHLLGEKPFGIDQTANKNILQALSENPHVIVRCSSELPYFPGAQKLIQWIRDRRYGHLMEVKCGFHHSSDMNLTKPINWKRRVETNGVYGCMGDLGMHTQHIPFRMGWFAKSVYADLQKIVTRRPDLRGEMVACDTWDNAVLTCRCADPATGRDFSLIYETKRMAPGATNTWFIEVYGTAGSIRFSTSDAKAYYQLQTADREQGWTRIETGSQSAVPSISGAIFEFGFSDALQQMLAAFLAEFSDRPESHPFRTVMPEETAWSHRIFTAALASHNTGRRVSIDEES